MGLIYADSEIDSYWDIPEEHRVAVENTLRHVGCNRYGNETLEGFVGDGALVEVKVQIGSGCELDLSDPIVEDGLGNRDPCVWHYNGMLHAGRVTEVHGNGYVSLVVRARY